MSLIALVVLLVNPFLISGKPMWDPLNQPASMKPSQCTSQYDSRNFPGARSTAFSFQNSDQNTLILTHGLGYDCFQNGPVVLTDTWEYSLENKLWRCVFLGVESHSQPTEFEYFSPSNVPKARSKGDNINLVNSGIIFGGSDRYGRAMNEIWELDFQTYWWRLLRRKVVYFGVLGSYSEDIFPYDSYFASVTKETDSSKTRYFFGGCNVLGCFNTMWEYNVTSGWFSWVAGSRVQNNVATKGLSFEFSSAYKPVSRGNVNIWKVGEFVYIHGGGFIGNDVGDFWVYNTTGREYAWIMGKENQKQKRNLPSYFNETVMPSARSGCVYFNGIENYLLLFGSTSGSSELWIYSVEINQFKRYNNSLEKTRIRGRGGSSFWRIDEKQVVIFGGQSLIPTNDLWLFNFKESQCFDQGEIDIDGHCRCRNEFYSGENCENWSCNDIHWEEDSVCGGHGTCANSNECICDDSYSIDHDCSVHVCNGVVFDDPAVCAMQGDCVIGDTGLAECACFANIYGENCEEIISDFATKVPDGIKLDFNVSMDLIEHQKEIDCHKIIANDDLLSMNQPKCQFFVDEVHNRTEFLSIIFMYQNLTVSEGYELLVRPITAPEETILVILQERKTDRTWIYILISMMLAIPAVICIICCVTSLLLCIILIQRRKLKKFSAIDDIEVIIAEQKSERNTPMAKLNIDQTLFVVDFDTIKIIKKIGTGGSSSVVFSAEWEGLKIAFKCFKTHDVMQDNFKFEEFQKEVRIISSVKHKFILQFFGATLKIPRVGILMELCELGDLKMFLSDYLKKNGTTFSFKEKIRLILEISSSMSYIHGSSIIHRDLKAENVLISDSINSRLMDFGLSTVVDRLSKTKTKRLGTSQYMAPEVTRGEDYTNKCDLFSFGIMVFEIITEKWSPYEIEGTTFNLEYKVSANPSFRPIIDDRDFYDQKWLMDMIRKCWSHFQTERPEFSEVLTIIEQNQKNVDDVNEGMYKSKRGSQTRKSMKNMNGKDERVGLEKQVREMKWKLEEKKKNVEYYNGERSRLKNLDDKVVDQENELFLLEKELAQFQKKRFVE